MKDLRVGISGWTYKPWRGTFYPEKLIQKKELYYASRKFNSIELNGSFYSLQRPSSYKKWYAETSKDFVFSIKANRYITHIKRLKEIDGALSNFFASGLLLLKEKLGSLLWQFPPSFKYDHDLFENFLKKLPQDTKKVAALAKNFEPFMKEKNYTHCLYNKELQHSVEIRNESFNNKTFLRLLKKYNVAIVIADTAGKWPYIEETTAKHIYIRLHGDKVLYSSGYNEHALKMWAKKISSWRKEHDIYIYFDNDAKVRAPFDAINLMKKLGVKWTPNADTHQTEWPSLEKHGLVS